MEDKFILGGKEFHSRFILGSGKYNLNLIKAAVEQGGAEIITLALRRANTQESENILDLYSEGSDTPSEHLRCKNCRGGSPDRTSEQSYGMWRFCKSGDHAGCKISVPG